jgi:hypothetical protein
MFVAYGHYHTRLLMDNMRESDLQMCKPEKVME